MAKEVFLSSVIAPGLVTHVLKGEIKIDSYMLRHGIILILSLTLSVNCFQFKDGKRSKNFGKR